jgi:Na+-translocating ferredoxin:NAD+ oxidoreductase RnfG subunit
MKNETNSHESSEYFDYYILFDENKTVRKVGVYNYMATHGQEITAKGWLKQFTGYDGFAPLQVDKDIDAISGATISVYAITADIEHMSRLLQTTAFAEPVLNDEATQ